MRETEGCCQRKTPYLCKTKVQSRPDSEKLIVKLSLCFPQRYRQLQRITHLISPLISQKLKPAGLCGGEGGVGGVCVVCVCVSPHAGVWYFVPSFGVLCACVCVCVCVALPVGQV